MITLLTI